MKVVTLPDAAAIATAAADVVCACLASHPRVAIGLPTGRTPVALYAELVRRHRDEGVSFRGMIPVQLDELVGVPLDDARSFRAFLRRELLDHVDVAEACEVGFDGALDLAILGIGLNGHIAFNEPGSEATSRIRVVALEASTRDELRAAFAPAEAPREALTVGIADLLDSRRVVLLATGAHKASIVARALGGAVEASCPASFLQLHLGVTVLLDASAASGLGSLA